MALLQGAPSAIDELLVPDGEVEQPPELERVPFVAAPVFPHHSVHVVGIKQPYLPHVVPGKVT